MKKFLTHSENENKEKHLLSKHLFQTSELAEGFACNENYKPIFKITGLLHDFGKYQPAFQDYLENGGRRGSVPHAKWGAGYARKFKMNDVSIAIDGHRKGLPNRTDWKNDTNQIVHDDEPDFDEAKNAFLVDTGFDEISLASVAAWERNRNNSTRKIDWKFNSTGSRIKLKHLNPNL